MEDLKDLVHNQNSEILMEYGYSFGRLIRSLLRGYRVGNVEILTLDSGWMRDESWFC